MRLIVEIDPHTERELLVEKKDLTATAKRIIRDEMPGVRLSESRLVPTLRVRILGYINRFMRGDTREDGQAYLSVDVRGTQEIGGGLRLPVVYWEASKLLSGPVSSLGANLRSVMDTIVRSFALDWRRANRRRG